MVASKGVIRIGDPLSCGGQVVSACSHFKVDGKEVAGVGDACHCNRHGDVRIVEGVDTYTFFGKKLALDGCKVSCGCTVISTTSRMVFTSGGGGAAEAQASPKPAKASPAPAASQAAAILVAQKHAMALAEPSAGEGDTSIHICDLNVLPAAPTVIGTCSYYYRPIHEEYVAKTGVTTLEALKAWAEVWNPWASKEVARRIARNRDRLLMPLSSDPLWSRHANFMARHQNCSHRPPPYYVTYGYYYCMRFGRGLAPKLSPKGQAWLKDARRRLQLLMDKGLSDNRNKPQIQIPCRRYPDQSVGMAATEKQLEINPILFKTFAFKTHVPAYLDAGLADLSNEDLFLIGTLPNVEEWMDPETLEQARLVGQVVLKEKAARGEAAASEALGRLAEAAERALERLREFLK